MKQVLCVLMSKFEEEKSRLIDIQWFNDSGKSQLFFSPFIFLQIDSMSVMMFVRIL